MHESWYDVNTTFPRILTWAAALASSLGWRFDHIPSPSYSAVPLLWTFLPYIFDPITSTARHRTQLEAKFALLREGHDVIELGLNSRNSADRLRIVELHVSSKTALLLRVGSVRTRQHPVSVSDGADTSERQVLCFSADNTVLVNVVLFRLTVTLESKCSIPTSIYHTSIFPTTTNNAVLRVSR